MSTTTFRRHHRACLDAAISRVYQTLGNGVRAAFSPLLVIAQSRSNLMDAPAVINRGVMHFPQLDALVNLARYYQRRGRALDDWSGAHGHPLAVIDSLAQHAFGGYRTPRFLASVWFGGTSNAEHSRRRWVLRHAAGERFRSFPLPIVLTRQMEHWFLRSPDHLDIDTALRRAEVLGLGGSPELAVAVLATRLGTSFANAAYWRGVLAWLARFEDDLMPGEVHKLVEHFESIREAAPSLEGRTVASVRRELDERSRRPPPPRGRMRRVAPSPSPVSWPPSPWGDARFGEWSFVELLSTEDLRAEGEKMRHCVGNYSWRCHSGTSRIWSLRRFGESKPVLTIEVDPKVAAVVMVRGFANRSLQPGELGPLQWWTSQQGLGASGSFARDLEALLRGSDAR